MQLLLEQPKEITLPPLRDYQQRIVNDTYKVIRDNSNAPCIDRTALIVSPTGSGKTITTTRIQVDAFRKSGRRSLFVVPLTCLVRQTYETFQRYNIDAGVIAASFNRGRNPHPDAPIQIASIDTLVNRDIPADIGLVILDEAHTCGYPKNSQRWVFDLDENGTWKHWRSDAWVIGCTATPWRTRKSESMGELYRHMVVGPQPKELMDLGEATGYTEGLTRAVYYGFPKSQQLNLAGIKTKMGDYDNSQVSVVVDNDEVTQNLIKQWAKLCIRGNLRNARRTIFFGVGIEHSAKVARAVNDYFREDAIAAGFEDGSIAKHIDGNAPMDEREFWFGKFRRGEILWLCSVDILSVGFDVPETECVIPRPTKSRVVNVQQVGRGARCAPWINKTDFYVLDIGRNAENYKIGRIDEEQQYSLENAELTKGEAPMKQCPECDAMVFAFHMTCPECGHEFPLAEKPKEKPVGELQVLISKEDQRKAKYYAALAKKAFENGYAPGYAMMKFKDKFGSFPNNDHKLHGIFGAEPTPENMKSYWVYLTKKAVEKGKDRKWCARFFADEFGRGVVIPG